MAFSDGDAQTLLLFEKSLNKDSKRRLLSGCLKIPFTIDLRQKVEKFVAVSAGKFIEFVEQHITLKLTRSYPEEFYCCGGAVF